MKTLIRFAPPNCIFFLEDIAGGKSPKIDERPTTIWSTRSCIIVGCLAWVDGETEMTVSDAMRDVPSFDPVFDGMLDTPNQAFQVSTSEKEVLLRCPVASHFTRVRVWTNRPTWPDHIVVALG